MITIADRNIGSLLGFLAVQMVRFFVFFPDLWSDPSVFSLALCDIAGHGPFVYRSIYG